MATKMRLTHTHRCALITLTIGAWLQSAAAEGAASSCA